MTAPAAARRARARRPLALWIVAVALPLVVWATAVVVQLAWLPELPDPVAIHWGADGHPDGFAPAWAGIALTGGLGVGLTLLFGVFVGIGRGPAPTATHKLLAVVSLAESLFVGGVITASLGVQRGVDHARDAGDIGGWVLPVLVLALLAAVAAWFALPKSVRAGGEAAPAAPLRLAPGERGVWIATVRVATSAAVAITCAVGVTVVAVAFAVAASSGALWPVLVLPALLLLACASGLVWRVRIDASGLTVRSLPLGWPLRRIRSADIATVETVDVEPLAEFGGWGWRWSPGGGSGVIAREGPGILVTTREGRRFTVTVDDAPTAAALLAAVAQSR